MCAEQLLKQTVNRGVHLLGVLNISYRRRSFPHGALLFRKIEKRGLSDPRSRSRCPDSLFGVENYPALRKTGTGGRSDPVHPVAFIHPSPVPVVSFVIRNFTPGSFRKIGGQGHSDPLSHLYSSGFSFPP